MARRYHRRIISSMADRRRLPFDLDSCWARPKSRSLRIADAYGRVYTLSIALERGKEEREREGLRRPPEGKRGGQEKER